MTIKPNLKTWVKRKLVYAADFNNNIRDFGDAIWVGTTAGDTDYYKQADEKDRIAIGAALEVFVSSGSMPKWDAYSGARITLTDLTLTSGSPYAPIYHPAVLIEAGHYDTRSYTVPGYWQMTYISEEEGYSAVWIPAQTYETQVWVSDRYSKAYWEYPATDPSIADYSGSGTTVFDNGGYKDAAYTYQLNLPAGVFLVSSTGTFISSGCAGTAWCNLFSNDEIYAEKSVYMDGINNFSISNSMIVSGSAQVKCSYSQNSGKNLQIINRTLSVYKLR